MPEPIKVRFTKVNKDLFWEVYLEDRTLLRWQGHDDAFWWDDVATSITFTDQKGYRLDPFTDTVVPLNYEVNGLCNCGSVHSVHRKSCTYRTLNF